MGQKLRAVRTRDVVKVAHCLGYVEARQTSTHRQFVHPDRPRLVTVVERGGRPYDAEPFGRMLSALGVTKREFAAILQAGGRDRQRGRRR